MIITIEKYKNTRLIKKDLWLFDKLKVIGIFTANSVATIELTVDQDIEYIRKAELSDITKINRNIIARNWLGYIFHNPLITQDIIHELKLDINFISLSDNPNINISFILQHRDKNWNWDKLTLNPGIIIEDIFNHPELKWDYYNIFERNDINPIFIRYLFDNKFINLDYITEKSPKYNIIKHNKFRRGIILCQFFPNDLVPKDSSIFKFNKYHLTMKQIEDDIKLYGIDNIKWDIIVMNKFEKGIEEIEKAKNKRLVVRNNIHGELLDICPKDICGVIIEYLMFDI
jgi:hypothetical protein